MNSKNTTLKSTFHHFSELTLRHTKIEIELNNITPMKETEKRKIQKKKSFMGIQPWMTLTTLIMIPCSQFSLVGKFECNTVPQ